jgi:fructose-bisphosphate aldolase, class II
MLSTTDIMLNARRSGTVLLAFNVPYLPMIEPVIKAVVELDSFALVEVARLEWTKFEAGSLSAVKKEFDRHGDLEHVRLHLDHVPVIDEDQLEVDYLSIIQEAIDLGYGSVMVDGSRLSLEDNIAATRKVAEIAHQAGIPCEAELGAVLGHEAGPLPPYDELFESGRGFTSPAEALRFVQETGCDWLSVAIGNIHGAISGTMKDQKKVEARLNLDHLTKLFEITSVPLVLHGGSGIQKEYVLKAIQHGISKVNIGSEIRQAYEKALRETGSIPAAQDAVFQRTSWLITDFFGTAGNRMLVNEGN